MKVENHPFTEHPGTIVRKLLTGTGLSATEAAKRLGVSRVQFTRLLNRKAGLSPEMALRIERVFGLSADDAFLAQAMLELKAAKEEVRNELLLLEPIEVPLNEYDINVVLDIVHGHEAALINLGAKSVKVFGSVARGTAQAGSDIDLCVDLKTSVNGLKLFGVQQKVLEFLQSLFNVPIDVTFTPIKNKRLAATIKRDAILAY